MSREWLTRLRLLSKRIESNLSSSQAWLNITSNSYFVALWNTLTSIQITVTTIS
ncbi:hypothetical protein THIOM_001515 [Candidatus Thiomargarita nelsonii]|uniref:Uncharacterized protein n=1 Tax=Candidatus Thiomargarita nelsonii TaxID=1003181 RepID=A0A176S3S6_9GAMM|nr:hypothetical protein THIOM_001515 [Candidatus Thiomargarita nelsonii]